MNDQHARITHERIAEIRGRCEAATGGPWEWEDAAPDFIPEGSHLGSLLICLSGVYENHAEDCHFIAHARQDVPDLLDALDAANARIAELEGENADYRAILDDISDNYDESGDEIQSQVRHFIREHDERKEQHHGR